MINTKSFQRCVVLILICILLISTSTYSAQAQGPQTITATGSLIGDGAEATPRSLTMTFPPAGGKVTGTISYSYEHSPTDVNCYGNVQINIEGTFTGGDGGSVSGTGSGTGKVECDNGDHVTGEYIGPWNGNLYANGTGNGTWVWTATLVEDINLDAEGSFSWQVAFSPDEFQAALASVVTSEYIYNTYGIIVEDSFGDDQWAQTAWTEQELTLLNDVLKELPPALIKNMTLTRIVRNKTNFDENGNPKPSNAGSYNPCPNLRADPDCSGSSATIRIFDRAHSPFDLSNDPNGDKNFKSTILHELTHALQYHKDDVSIYKDAYASPLMQNYMDATRPITDMTQLGFWGNNGWLLNPQGLWTLTGAPGNLAPTNYAGKNPKEDMSESVRLYVYDPQKLLTSSPQRYNFIRDQMFGGVEYEDGVQKQP